MTDNACWELLIKLAEMSGHDKLVEPFSRALVSEQEHLVKIERWLHTSVMERQ